MKRVMIIGQPGSGKSTLARRIGAARDLPVVHMDRIHWMPNWVERPRDERITLALAEQAKPEWVFEGGLSATWDNRFDRADTVIWLDLPLGLRLRRVILRTLRGYGTARPDMPEGCGERFNYEFYKWIWDTRHSARLYPARLKARAEGVKPFHHLTSPATVDAFERVHLAP